MALASVQQHRRGQHRRRDGPPLPHLVIPSWLRSWTVSKLPGPAPRIDPTRDSSIGGKRRTPPPPPDNVRACFGGRHAGEGGCWRERRRRRAGRAGDRRGARARPPGARLRPGHAARRRPSPPAARARSGSCSRRSRPATRTPTSTSSPRTATRSPPSARSAIGPNGGGQTIVRLTDSGEVAPGFVSAHPSASCLSNPAAATGLQHDVEATPKGGTILNTRNPLRRSARTPSC